MDKKPDNPLTHVEQPRLDYPLVFVAALLFAVLTAGVVVAVSGENTAAAALFVSGIFILACLVLMHIASAGLLAAMDDRKFIRWNAALPELQRQNVNIEVTELARHLNTGKDEIVDLLSAYIVAGDLALRQIQQDENLPLVRHVSIGSMPFDGVLIDRDLIRCIEVAFLVTPDVRQDRIEAMLKKITQATNNLVQLKSRLRLKLMLVLVTQLTPDEVEQLRAMLVTRRFSDTPVDIDIRLFDFEELQRVYVSE